MFLGGFRTVCCRLACVFLNRIGLLIRSLFAFGLCLCICNCKYQCFGLCCIVFMRPTSLLVFCFVSLVGSGLFVSACSFLFAAYFRCVPVLLFFVCLLVTALRVHPAVTRLTVYRRLYVYAWIAFFLFRFLFLCFFCNFRVLVCLLWFDLFLLMVCECCLVFCFRFRVACRCVVCWFCFVACVFFSWLICW